MAELALGHKVIEEYNLITQVTTGIQSQDGRYGAIFEDLYWLQVPVGQEIVFLPDHRFGIYLLRLLSPLDAALADDGGAFTNESEVANTAGTNEMTLMPATELTNDAYYFGFRFPFTCLTLKYSTAGVCTADDLAWEYYNGSSWVTLTGITDLTLAYEASAGTYNVTFNSPQNWEQVVIDGLTMYWVRARIVTADYTTIAVGDQAWIGGALECDDNDLVSVQVRNPRFRNPITIYEGRYERCKELTDIDKRTKLNYLLGEEFRARSGDWIVVAVNTRGGLLDVSGCHFILESLRARTSIMG